ncbi:MAG: acyl--CoA ligase [Spiribacter salinus]|uniref:Acyl--CoA ligase n=1 Tax=Spiribacter salinus TaxID=1335746 RepID=A0A540VSI0_9GAMM|nr:MAG: acyl--CoA ligase [Spiribacter salinus]
MGSPDKAAITGWAEAGEWKQYSFAELEDMANGVARALVGAGLSAQSRIGILALNSAEYMAVVLGAMRAGLIAVPINVKFSAETITGILEECEIGYVFCDQTHLDRVHTNCRCVVLDGSGSDGFTAFLDRGHFEVVTPDEDGIALLLYTSGTTGRPKAAMLTHEGQRWVVNTRLADFPGTDNERFIVAAPLYHMNALALLFLTLGAGATCVLLPRFETGVYADGITRWKCTWVTAVPPMIAMLLRDEQALAGTDFDSVKFVRLGSAVVTPQLREQIRQICPEATVINAYGTTESGPVTFMPLTAEDGPVETLGYEHPEVAVRLVDASGAQTDQGVLEIRSPAAMRGYYRRPHIPHPFTQDGYYRTGDIFRRDAEGRYYFVGRHDDMFVCGGENIYPAEVEMVLERHSEIQQACVVPVEDEIKGYKPVAFVAVREGSVILEKDVQDFVLSAVPVYQYPRRIFFVSNMPLAGTNKVDREQLKEKAAKELKKT